MPGASSFRENFFEVATRLSKAGRKFAVATVLKAVNSTPVKAGAKAIFDTHGRIHGTVGGGIVEGEATRLAKKVVLSGKPVVFDYDLRGPGPQEPGPICGGSMRVLVAPGNSASTADYRTAAVALQKREMGLWVTEMRGRSELQVIARFSVEGANGERRSRRERPALQAQLDEQAQVFVEPVVPGPVLLIVGGGHVSQALAAHAALLDFNIVVFEDRPEFANSELFPPGTKTICGDVGQQLAGFPVDRNTFIVLVTRGHRQDAEALRACIKSPAGYIGMIGSRRKVPLVRREFLKSGWATAGEFKRVYAPIGLDLGAVTVPEIAVSIVAQLVAVRRKGIAPRMPFK